MRIQIGPFWFHRKEQWDLGCWPWLAIHQYYNRGNGSRRVFCIWRHGLVIGDRSWKW